MRCAQCGGALPAGAKFCPSCGTQVPSQAGGMTTGGGAFVGGGVQTGGGDFVGRDQTVHGDSTRTSQQGVSAQDLTALFQSVYQKIDARPPNPQVDAKELKETVQRVEQEAAKGDKADPTKVRRWLGTLKDLAPDVLEVAVNALTNPGAAVASGVRLVAEQLQAGAS